MTTAPAPEPSIFTRIIRGELPGRFVWRDDEVVAFLTIAPLRPGHVLVVPVAEVDQWLDLPAPLWARVNEVAAAVGAAVRDAFSPARVGLMIAGLEVPHCHLHVVPIESEADLDFARADHGATAEALDEAAARIRTALVARGHGARVAD